MANQEHLDILYQGVDVWNKWREEHIDLELNFRGVNLSGATLIETNFTKAILTNCNIYGIAAWNVELVGATQNNLIITPKEEPTITVDNLKIAQFIYLLLHNEEIREVIDTITSKVVLILGRFIPERKFIWTQLGRSFVNRTTRPYSLILRNQPAAILQKR